MGAADTLQNTYAAQAPKINAMADQFGGVTNDLLARYTSGDPTVTAANDYVQSTLASNPGDNPYLNDMIALARDNTRNDLQARMGTRGLTGSSDYYESIGRGMNETELGLRYSDYDRTMDRKAQAAGMAGGVAAGQYIPLASALSTGGFATGAPMDAALRNAAGVGGLLGGYTNSTGTQKTSGGFLGDLLLSGLGAAGSYFGGRG